MDPFAAAAKASERTRQRTNARKAQLRQFRFSTVERIREQQQQQETRRPQPPKETAWMPCDDDISISPDPACPATDTSICPVPGSRIDEIDTDFEDSVLSRRAITVLQDTTFADIPLLPDTQVNRDWAQASLLATF